MRRCNQVRTQLSTLCACIRTCILYTYAEKDLRNLKRMSKIESFTVKLMQQLIIEVFSTKGSE